MKVCPHAVIDRVEFGICVGWAQRYVAVNAIMDVLHDTWCAERGTTASLDK